MGKISIVKTNQGIGDALNKALELIGGFEQYIEKNDTVMLKPNLNGTEGITSLDLVEALIQLLFDFHVKKIVIAESTFGSPQMTDMFFRQTGYTELADKYHLDLLNLNNSEIRKVAVKNPLILNTLNIAKEVFAVDKLINIPVMKVHYATGVTLALKNLKGLLVRDEKRHFHEVGLHHAIVDLNNTIKPHLNILDCISCMERMGPRGGDIVELGLIMAGENAAEVDYIGSRIMGYTVDEIKHLEYYIEANLLDLDRIEVVGERIKDVSYSFRKVALDNIVPRKFKVYNKNACSSCMNAFLLSCQFLREQGQRSIDVYMGESVDSAIVSSNFKIAFGNCCPDDRSFGKRIKGCPPYPFALRDFLESKAGKQLPEL